MEYERPDSLAQRITDGTPLTEAEQDALHALLTKQCQQRTKGRVAFALRVVPDISSYGIYGRVMITPHVEYVAGQSYPDEIRTVRELLMGA